MNWKNLFKRADKFSPTNPRDPGLVKLFMGYGSESSSGIHVSEETALAINAVYSAVNLIATSIASLPIGLYKNLPNGGKELQFKDKRHLLLSRKPNSYQNSNEFLELIITHFLLRGRSISRIISNNRGEIIELRPLDPTQIRPFFLENGKIAYEYQTKTSKEILLAAEVVDMRGFSTDGINCLNPIQQQRDSFGIAKSAENFAGKYFGQGLVTSGVLKVDKVLNDDQYKRIKDSMERNRGNSNMHKPLILENGMEWRETTGINAEDLQLIETRNFSVLDIARIFRVPPHKLMQMERATFSNIEQQNIDFVTDSLLPRIKKLEAALNTALLSDSEPDLYFKINLLGLLRGDSNQRADYYGKRFNMGTLSQDDIRELEDEDPLPNGQGSRYYVQMNLVPLDMVDEVLKQKQTPTPFNAPKESNPDDQTK